MLSDDDRPQRRLVWHATGYAALEELADRSPQRALAAVRVMDAMARAGFNFGRATATDGVWYFPETKAAVGVFYTDDGWTLTVVDVAGCRRPRKLP